MQLSKIINIAAIFLTLFVFSKTVVAGEFIQLAGVIHVHSTYSSGRYSIEELVADTIARSEMGNTNIEPYTYLHI